MSEEYKKWVGKVAIRRGNDDQEPAIVFITGMNKFDLLVSEVVNTGTTVFSTPDDLLNFDFYKYITMFYKWKIEQAPKRTERMEKLLTEYVEQKRKSKTKCA